MIRNLTLSLKGMGRHGKFLRQAVSGFSLCFRKLTLGAVWKMDWEGRQGELRSHWGRQRHSTWGLACEPPCLLEPRAPSLSFPPPARPVVSEPSSRRWEEQGWQS